MRRLALAVLLFSPPGAFAERYELTGVRVVDVVQGRVLGGPHTIVIDGDRIVSVEGTAARNGLNAIDAAGLYVIPGLVDSHVHLFNTYSKRPPNDWAFPMFVANGVTGVREMAADRESIAIVKRWRDDEALIAPRIIATGLPIRGDDPVGTQVAAIAAAGGDFVKSLSSTPTEMFRAIEAAARTHRLTVAGHTPGSVHALDALALQTNEHLSQLFEACSSREDDGIEQRTSSGLDEPSPVFLDVLEAYDEARCATVARKLAASGRAEVPTLAIYRTPSRAVDTRWALLRRDERERWDRILADPAVLDEPHRAAQWRAALRIVGVLDRADVRIVAGTDTPMPLVFPGWSLHEELEALVESGLTPANALRAATLTPAQVFEDERAGEIKPGFRADLVVLRANPLEDIANTRTIEAVVLRGRYLDRAALDRMLKK